MFSSLSALCLSFLVFGGSYAVVDAATSDGMGFAISAKLNFDATLPGNNEIMGMHLHTGSSTTNGPVNIISCGSAPLPSQNGPCVAEGQVDGDRYMAVIDTPTSLGAWDLGVNNATAVTGATTLAAGAPTTFASFVQALEDCTDEECLVYFNIHTNYTFSINDGPFGLVRAQLKPVDCPDGAMSTTKCYGASGTISSNATNQVDGLPTQLPDNAGEAAPAWDGDILVMWYNNATGPGPAPAPTPKPPTSAAAGSVTLTTALGGLAFTSLVGWWTGVVA